MFALLSNFTKALVIFFARSSKLPAQPTQKSTSGCLPWAIYSAIVGTFICSLIIQVFWFIGFRFQSIDWAQDGILELGIYCYEINLQKLLWLLFYLPNR